MFNDTFQKWLRIGALAVAGLMMVYGLFLLLVPVEEFSRSYLGSITFGADYYTESYGAMVSINKNLCSQILLGMALQSTIQHVGGAILLLLGCLVALLACSKSPAGKADAKSAETNETTTEQKELGNEVKAGLPEVPAKQSDSVEMTEAAAESAEQ